MDKVLFKKKRVCNNQRVVTVIMTRCNHLEFEDDDSSSVGSIVISSEGNGASAARIRYHSPRSYWKTRTSLERTLITICLGLCGLCILLIILFSTARHHWDETHIIHVNSKDGLYCLSEHCVTVAASIINSIDTTVDPCDDFYEYACGSWTKKNPIPDGKSMWGVFGKLEQDNQLVVRNALEKPMSEMNSKAERKAKVYYLSCMDANETIESLGAKPMLDFLEKIGGWNATSSYFDINKWNFQISMHVLQNVYNMAGLFSWAVNENDRNSSRHIIQIDQGGLTLPTTDNYLNKTEHGKVLEAYLDYMTKIGILLGGVENDTKRQMQAVIDFETKIAEITIPQEDRRDEEKLYHLMSIAELQKLAPFMSWVDYFQNATKSVNKKINSKTMIVNFAPEYFKKLNTLLQEYNKTTDGKIVLSNYLVWQTVKSLTAFLSKPFRDAYKGLRKALMGSDGKEEQWRYCVSDTSTVMGFALGAMFVKQVFHGNSKPKAEEMIVNIRNAFVNNFKNLEWMDVETKKLAEEKANAITDMIGFPNFILNTNELDERYRDLTIKPNEYFLNNIRINKYTLKKNLEKLDQPVNKTTWIMTPATVNAYYTPTKNQIVFPAGILQSPFYDMNNPNSLNYGGIGVVMGHELTHAFDDQGREYDLNGNLHKWWNSDTIDRFKNETECLVEQYEKFESEGKRLNGRQTLGENIADNGGLKAAYHAYLNLNKTYEDQMPLPGLPLNHRQLFFLNFAQVWCSSITSELINLQIEKDTHCPPKFRVLGPLANFPEFAEEFHCPKGSKMNPINKCEVW